MQQNSLFIFGKQPCLYVLSNHSDKIKAIYLGKEIERSLFSRFSRTQKPIIRADAKKMQSLARGGNHQGFILELFGEAIFAPKFSEILREARKIIVLVGISDVGNIGSIARSAVALGADLLISTQDFSASGAIRASSGAFLDLPCVIYKDYLSLANELKMARFALFGSDIRGENISELKNAPNKWALFLGNEGDGLPQKLLKRVDSVLCVKLKAFNSLNVAVAAGILIHKLNEADLC